MPPIAYTTTQKKSTGPPYKILSMRQTTRSNTDSTLDSATSGASANTANTATQDTSVPVLRRTILDTVFDDVPARGPTAHITEIDEDEEYPLPTLRTARPPSPEPFEPEDEDLIADQGDAYNGATGTLGPIEESEGIQNPVPSLIAESLQREQTERGQSTAFLTPSTDRPMNAQTARSFEARTGTTIPRASTSNALSRSSTVVTFGDVAPSEAEIFTQAGLLHASKGEKAPERKARQDENDLRIATHFVSILRRIEELERKGNAQHHEVLIRLQDIERNAPATASPESLATLQADIAAIKARANQGRVAIASATEALNELVNLPREVTNLSRSVQGLVSARDERQREASTNLSLQRDEGRGNNNDRGPNSAQRDGDSGHFPNTVFTSHHEGINGGNRTGGQAERNKVDHDNRGSSGRNNGRGEYEYGVDDVHERAENARSAGKRPFAGSGGGDSGANKRFKNAEASYDDVYLYDVDTTNTAPTRVAHLALDRVGMNSSGAFLSVQQARNAPKSVISIRFRNSDIADEFIDRLRANAPASMANLHAVRPAVYEKRPMGKSQKDPW
ncbi:hypothetical protein B0H16DRAFT_1692321 [Mycena metata]|uniref:Uncharacterized protein n=1 Tax=Mycena metata TaxID=1033252 RepID=A0AAD7IPI9_9AGAR|nr:hypothetical protein B0H16DRAFT_1692321 [Mycena metata]